MEESTLPPPPPLPLLVIHLRHPKMSPMWQYFVYNEQTGESSCQVETGRSDDEQETGPSKKICMQEVAGKFPTNLKRVRGGKKQKKGELVRGQATLQQAFAGRSAYNKSSDRYRFLFKKLALFIGCTNLSIHLVENDELRGLIAVLHPRW